ncbi:helix-turn-helix domain-containing protein, partial [Streptomyces phaeochromogenes]|uniref:winged helix-turn-helix domain-containing protein n=1 Tax=Streptomyces phaeochromogenes TaxID=1923 RepID=UPI0036AB2363
MREVWGWDFGDLSTVTVHVRRLRNKVEDDPAKPRLIQTVWGVGYRFEVAGPSGSSNPSGPSGLAGLSGSSEPPGPPEPPGPSDLPGPSGQGEE